MQTVTVNNIIEPSTVHWLGHPWTAAHYQILFVAEGTGYRGTVQELFAGSTTHLV